MKRMTDQNGKIVLDNFSRSCHVLVAGKWIKCHNIETAKRLLKGEKSEAKNKEER